LEYVVGFGRDLFKAIFRIFLEELKKNKNTRMAHSGSRIESRLPDTMD